MFNEDIKDEKNNPEEVNDSVIVNNEVVQTEEELKCCEECTFEGDENLEKAEEESDENGIDQAAKKVPFFKSLICAVIDQAAIASVALVLFLAFNYLVLRLMGYEVKPEFLWTILLITYVISSLLYQIIMETTVGNTVGRQLTNLKVDNLEL